MKRYIRIDNSIAVKLESPSSCFILLNMEFLPHIGIDVARVVTKSLLNAEMAQRLNRGTLSGSCSPRKPEVIGMQFPGCTSCTEANCILMNQLLNEEVNPFTAFIIVLKAQFSRCKKVHEDQGWTNINVFNAIGPALGAKILSLLFSGYDGGGCGDNGGCGDDGGFDKTLMPADHPKGEDHFWG